MPIDLSAGVIDTWINPNLGPQADAGLDVSHLFPEMAARRVRGTTLSQLVEEMDAAQVRKAVLCAGYSRPDDLDWVRAAIKEHPDRFVGSQVVDPRAGMAAVRAVERAVREDGFRLIRMMALQTQLPYNDAQYYPVYAKCVELGVPVGLNVGFPGPLVPSKYQDPMPIDDVCAFFPELVVLLQHGGEPWVDVCVKLMVKWRNVHYVTSAFAPKHIPTEIISYLNSRGADRVMFGSDYPLLALDRCTRELGELPIRDQDRFVKFVRGNAQAMFFE